MNSISNFGSVDNNIFSEKVAKKSSLWKKAMVITAIALSSIALAGMAYVCALGLLPITAGVSIAIGGVALGVGITKLVRQSLEIEESSDSDSIHTDSAVLGVDEKQRFSNIDELREVFGCDREGPIDKDLKQTCDADLKILWIENDRLVSEEDENKIRCQEDYSVDTLLKVVKKRIEEKLTQINQLKYLDAVFSLFSQAPVQMLSFKNQIANISSGSCFQDSSKKVKLILSNSAPPKVQAMIEGQVNGKAFTSEMNLSFQNSVDVKGDIHFLTTIK